MVPLFDDPLTGESQVFQTSARYAFLAVTNKGRLIRVDEANSIPMKIDRGNMQTHQILFLQLEPSPVNRKPDVHTDEGVDWDSLPMSLVPVETLTEDDEGLVVGAITKDRDEGTLSFDKEFIPTSVFVGSCRDFQLRVNAITDRIQTLHEACRSKIHELYSAKAIDAANLPMLFELQELERALFPLGNGDFHSRTYVISFFQQARTNLRYLEKVLNLDFPETLAEDINDGTHRSTNDLLSELENEIDRIESASTNKLKIALVETGAIPLSGKPIVRDASEGKFILTIGIEGAFDSYVKTDETLQIGLNGRSQDGVNPEVRVKMPHHNSWDGIPNGNRCKATEAEHEFEGYDLTFFWQVSEKAMQLTQLQLHCNFKPELDSDAPVKLVGAEHV